MAKLYYTWSQYKKYEPLEYTEYPQGFVYLCIQTANLGESPVSAPLKWKLCFASGFPGTVTSIAATLPIAVSPNPITTTGTVTSSMATNKLIGRYTAGTGVMEEVTIGSGLTLSGGGTLSASLGGIAWLLDGNTVGSEKWIGTIDNFDFPIRTNNTERMVVASGGNVGVGVAVPTARVHVVGSGTTSASINFLTANSDSSKSFGHYDGGFLSRNGGIYSIDSGTSTSWGASAGATANGTNTQSVFIGYFAGGACTNNGVVIISGDTNNVTSANYGTGTVAIGNGAVIAATGTWNVAYGLGAGRRTTTGGSNTYLGSYADLSDSTTTISNITGNYNIVIGSLNQGASAGTSFVGGNAFSSNFVVHGIGTTSNQIVFGGGISDTYFTDFYIGKGVTNTSPTAITIHATSGSGTDIAGANLQYAVGQGTGTGLAGDHIFYKATSGSSGSSLNALSETFKIKGTDGQIFRDGTLYSVETGSFARENTSWGYNSLASATGVENTAVGFGALASVVGGTRLTAVGNRAAISNVSGVQGSYFGFKAGGLHTSDGASLFGEFSAYYATTASYMTAVGHRTMIDSSVVVGITGGSYVTAIGASAAQRGSNASISNSTYIGSRTISEASNEAVIGGYGNTNFYFGGGRFGTAGSSSLYAITMQPTSPASGSSFYANQTDANGVNWTFGVSQATGSGTSGDMIWQYAPSGSTGTTLTTLTEAMRLKGTTGELQVVNGVSIGTAGSVLGLLKLNGNTSGTVTINTAAAAGTWTLTLPTTDGNAGEYLQTDGAGVTTWVVPSGYDLTSQTANGVTVALSSTVYAAPFFGGSFNATEGNRQLTIKVAGTVGNLYVRTNSAQSGLGSLVITVRKNGADTAVTLTIAAGAAAATFSDVANTVSFAAGDLIGFKVVNNAAATSANIMEVGVFVK